MRKFSNIMIAIAGKPSDDQAIALACNIARRDKAKVTLFYVIVVQRALPVDSENAPEIERGEQMLQRAEKLAKDLGIRAETELLQARVAGSVLLDEAAERGVDLIVMGVRYREPVGELFLGSTAIYVLKNAPCQVWLCREALADEAGSPHKK